MVDGHDAAVQELLRVLYGGVAGGPPLPDRPLLGCQRTIGKEGARFFHKVLKSVQRCRNDIGRGKLRIAPASCATADPRTASAIAKAERRLRRRIGGRCDDPRLSQLDVCAVDAGGAAQTLAEGLACLVAALRGLVDRLIDLEYAAPARCGDRRVDTLDEECDGPDDAACPGRCGGLDGPAPCLCLDRPRLSIQEEATTDLDFGDVHDRRSNVGRYVLELYDCDGPGGPDAVCIAGPSCALSKVPCASDSDCPAPGDACRRTRLATGPACQLDHTRPCATDADCPGAGNFCRDQFARAPIPLSGGGVSLCILEIFTEDVVGTVNVATGATALRRASRMITHFGQRLAEPCPVCGGFCDGVRIPEAPRILCADDGDCPSGLHCVTEPVCDRGPNTGRPCRREPPFGGATGAFGTTSVDCRPQAGLNISGAGLEVRLDPATTGTATLVPDVPCEPAASASKRCVGGAHEGRPCTVASDCPDGTCNFECFCPGQRLSRRCAPACVGGSNDAAPCAVDVECPGGFCRPGDCRENPLDPDGPGEGICTGLPSARTCSVTTVKLCADDADCRPPQCVFCAPGETCGVATGVGTPEQCFVNAGIVRTGVADPVRPVTVGTFCIGAMTSAGVNAATGLPAPGAIRQPETRTLIGF